MTWLGLYSSWLSVANFSAIAWRSSGIPELGVYLVKPLARASAAGGLDVLGRVEVRFAGPKPQTSMPSAFMALAFESMERVSDGVRLFAREEMEDIGSWDAFKKAGSY